MGFSGFGGISHLKQRSVAINISAQALREKIPFSETLILNNRTSKGRVYLLSFRKQPAIQHELSPHLLALFLGSNVCSLVEQI